jgi:hypothetical protein
VQAASNSIIAWCGTYTEFCRCHHATMIRRSTASSSTWSFFVDTTPPDAFAITSPLPTPGRIRRTHSDLEPGHGQRLVGSAPSTFTSMAFCTAALPRTHRCGCPAWRATVRTSGSAARGQRAPQGTVRGPEARSPILVRAWFRLRRLRACPRMSSHSGLRALP